MFLTPTTLETNVRIHNGTHSNDVVYEGAPCVHMKPVYLLIQGKGFIFEREVVEL